MKDLEQMIENFRDREYRESYAAGFLNSWIAHQLTIVRQQRGLTQNEVAQRVGTKQSGISRMEREDYGRWNFSTLQKVAFALDCRLKVSLETFGSLIHEALEFSEDKLQRPSFDEDLTLNPSAVWCPAIADAGPLGEMRRKVLPWLWERGPLERLAGWLQGYDLPPVGDEIQPSQWLLECLRSDEQELRGIMAQQLSKAILRRRWDVEPPATRREEFVRNLLALAEGLRMPTLLGDAVWHVYQRRAYLPFDAENELAPGHPLVRAITYNQPDGRFRELWRSRFLAERALPDMHEYVAHGLLGFSYVGLAPNVAGIVEAASQARHWSLPVAKTTEILEKGFQRVWQEFSIDQKLKVNVIEAAKDLDAWSGPIVVAWRMSIGDSLPAPETDPYVLNVIKFAEHSRYCCAGV